MTLFLAFLFAGWTTLFDGTTLNGWTPEMAAKWRVADGAIMADAGEYGWLRSNESYKDFELKVEFRTSADGNSGIFLRSAKTGNPHETGYELQIFDTHPKFPTGGIVNHVPPSAKVMIKPNQWMSYNIVVKGDHIVAKLDEKKVLDWHDGKSASGHVGLQYNKDKKIEFRNIKIRAL